MPSRHKEGLAYFRKYRAEKRKLLSLLKTERGCKLCFERDSACLQFHHRNPKEKTYSVSRLYAGTWGWARILLEIEKCDILCANCHLKLHRYEDDQKRIG